MSSLNIFNLLILFCLSSGVAQTVAPVTSYPAPTRNDADDGTLATTPYIEPIQNGEASTVSAPASSTSNAAGSVSTQASTTSVPPSSTSNTISSVASLATTKTATTISTNNAASNTVTTTAAPSVPCEDKLANCFEYVNTSCSYPFEQWALENCPRSCGKCPTTASSAVTQSSSVTPSQPTEAPFGERQKLGHIHGSDIEDASGIAISRIHPNILYTHNDKGDSSRFFAVDATSGQTVSEYDVKDAQNYDWEDIAIGPCADDCQVQHCGSGITPSRYCLYIADIGDHAGDGSHNIIYMVREPQELKEEDQIEIAGTLKFEWAVEDAETVMVSPSGEVYVVSKVKDVGATLAKLPRSAWNDETTHTLNTQDTVTLPIVDKHHNGPQGGDISPAGDEMLLVYETKAYYFKFYDTDYLSALANNRVTPLEIETYHDVHETGAIAWKEKGEGFYTLAEGKHEDLVYYPRLVNPTAQVPVVG